MLVSVDKLYLVVPGKLLHPQVHEGAVRSRPSPQPPEQAMPVQVWHEVGLHVVHDPTLLALVQGEGLQGLAVVVKLGQDDRVVAGDQRARGVAIILFIWMVLLHYSADSSVQNTRLGSHSGGGLSCGQVGAVSDAEHVGVNRVLQCLLVEVQPAGLVSQWGAFQHIRGAHGGSNMQHLILKDFGHSGFVQVLKHCLLFLGPHFDEVVSEIYIQVSSPDNLPQSVRIFLDAKQNG